MNRLQLATYLWLVTLLSTGGKAVPQANDEYKKLGWAERTVEISVMSTPGRSLAAPTPEAIIRNNQAIMADVKRFEQQFPGRSTVVLTNELLQEFDNTKQTTEGFHLFLGMEGGLFTPMIVHTNIDRETMPNGNYNVGYYHADFSRAYRWTADKKWMLEQKSMLGGLKSRIKGRINLFSASRIKGFYLSKDALLSAWKRSGRKPMTLFFLLNSGEAHLLLPYCPLNRLPTKVLPVAASAKRKPVKIKVSLFYTNAQFSSVALAKKAGTSSGGTGGPGQPPGGNSYKIHGSVRCCPAYCGGLDLETEL